MGYELHVYIFNVYARLLQFLLQDLNTLLVLAVVLALEVLVGVIVWKVHFNVRGYPLLVDIVAVVCEILLCRELDRCAITKWYNALYDSFTIGILSNNRCCSELLQSGCQYL